MTDYEDLAFKPAMTWQGLCEWVRSIAPKLIEKGENLSMYSNEFFLINNICFAKCGNVLTEERCYIAENVSYDRMKNIIDNLYGED